MNIICMGDSITYGLGLEDLSLRWTDLAARETGHTLHNRGVSGDTTGGMLARCQTQAFGQGADAMILLGGINDISILGELRAVRANVISIFRQAQAEGLPLILGIPLPVCPEDLGAPVWEPDRDNGAIARLCGEYAQWVRLYAQANGIPTIDFRAPFLLESGAPDRTLFQDGLHPTREGHRRMARAAAQTLKQVLP